MGTVWVVSRFIEDAEWHSHELLGAFVKNQA